MRSASPRQAMPGKHALIRPATSAFCAIQVHTWGLNRHPSGSRSGPFVTQVVSERQLTILVRIPRAAYDCDALAARCANTIATPPRVAAEANNKRSVISSESMTTPPKAAIAGTES